MDSRPETGVAEELEPGLRRVLAGNASPMTHWGTNTYLVGQSQIAVIDPGPEDPAHFEALMAAIGSAAVSHILVTHAHRDHSGLVPALRAATGAPVLAFGAPRAGRSPLMKRLAANGLAGGGEGVDAGFRPDAELADGETVAGVGWALEVLHTPGHFAGHLSFRLGDAVLTGDHVMGWASTLISPPDGDLGAFLASCARLGGADHRVFHAGHGASIDAPRTRVEELVAHREGRTRAILSVLGDGPATIRQIVTRVYTETPDALHRAAARNVFAHLVDLVEQNRVTASPALTETAVFRISGSG
jgi:glyoxylase-like metal-dependent hydrolase (beta-lactamase superfamily II)